MKGKYKMWAFWFGSGGNTSFEWYMDGKSMDKISMFSDSGWGGTAVEIADVEFTETASHKVKSRCAKFNSISNADWD